MNTFWTLIDDNYYRVYNGVLREAPIKNSTIDIENQIIVSNIDTIKLDTINQILGSNFRTEDFSLSA